MSAALWVGGWPIADDGGVLVSGLGPPPDVVGPILPLVPTIGELFDTGALLTAVVTSNGAVTTVIFEYGTTTAYGTTIAADQSPLSGTAIAELVSALVGGLTADTTYHWRVSATNSAGTTVSGDQSFTTLPAGTIFFDPLFNSLVPTTAGNPTPTFTRTTTAYVEGVAPTGNANDGQILIAVASGEARFRGARRISANNWSRTYSNGKLIPPDNLLGYVAENTGTNNCLQSQTFDNATWVKAAATVTADAQTAPDGTLSADTLTDDATAAVHGVSQASISGSTWFNVYVKAGTLNWVQLASTVGSPARANFNLATGAIGSTAGTTSAARIELLGNGWYRCTLPHTVGSNTYAIYAMNANIAGTPTYTGTGSGTIHIWGAQCAGAYEPASYIPTTTVAVTRVRDLLTYPFALNMGATIGTVYAEVKALGVSGDDQAWLTPEITNNLSPLNYGVGVPPKPLKGQLSVTTANTAPVDTLVKGAYAYSAPNASLCLNGGTVATTASFVSWAGNTSIYIGTDSGESAIRGTIRNIRIYNSRIIDANLIPLTAIAPTVTTVAASGITATGATLNGTVTSNGLPTTVDFQYGKTTNYNKTVTATQSPLAANAVSSAVSVALTGLQTGTLYHYRVVGTNSSGATYGSDMTFTPAVPTDPNFANVSLLMLGGSGAVDSSNNHHTLTNATGTGTITAIPAGGPFGTGSISVTSSACCLNAVSHASLLMGTGDFTWEGWVKVAVLPSPGWLLYNGGNTAFNPRAGIAIYAVANAGIAWFLGGNETNAKQGSYPPTATWLFMAYSRIGGTGRLFSGKLGDANAVQLGSSIADASNYGLVPGLGIGGQFGDNNNCMNHAGAAELSNVRITKGVGRYSAAFPMPTAAFPTS